MDHVRIRLRLAGLVAASSRDQERDCERIAIQHIEEKAEPQFNVVSADFYRDPYLICADRYWYWRFIDEPTLATALACARWMAEHVAAYVRELIREKWALGYAFVTRDSIESLNEIADASNDFLDSGVDGCDMAYFATLYHAGKLRANDHFDELAEFLDRSLLVIAAGPHQESLLIKALRALAAFGRPGADVEMARELFDEVWDSSGRTFAVVDVALHALDSSAAFDGRSELLRECAIEAVEAYPRRDILHFRLATGLWLCGEYDSALLNINTALRLLPAIGGGGSHTLLQEQYRARRESIEVAIVNAHNVIAMRESVERTQDDLTELSKATRDPLVKLVGGAMSFAVNAAFTIVALCVSQLGFLPSVSSGWVLAVLGCGLVLLILMTIGGTWTIARRTSRRLPSGE